MVPDSRIRPVNTRPVRPDGRHVLYWMVAHRRVTSNFALERAAALAVEFGRPLVIFEPLRVDYPWASDRLHRFVIDGMADNAAALRGRPVTYLAHVEERRGEGRALLAALARDAVAVVTDDYPAFFLPKMIEAAGRRLDVRLEAVDSNGLLPIRGHERAFATAFAFRAMMQRTLRPHLAAWPAPIDWNRLPAPQPLDLPDGTPRPTPPQALEDPDQLMAALPIDHAVPATPLRGGTRAGTSALNRFAAARLPRYAEDRNHPDLAGTSGLSPYLRFGHVSAHDVFAAVMTAEGWTSRRLAATGGGKREGWWGVSPSAEGFLDQLVTWRELGFATCAADPAGHDSLDGLPTWARRTLDLHAADPRAVTYTRDEFEHAATHDRVWNAAQRQLTREGWMHNYLRMLWGKKILEWTSSPAEALETMIHVMNRYALDGRDPNSYTGYTWTLGRYDRPWAPERPVFGTVRYMSSENTVRKLRMKTYLAQFGG